MNIPAIYIALLAAIPAAVVFFILGFRIGAHAKQNQGQHSDGLLPIPPAPKVPTFVGHAYPVAAQQDEPEGDATDARDKSPDEQLESAGYECREIEDDDELVRTVAGEFNFAEADDDIVCNVCRTNDYPISVWGTSDTPQEGLVGFFCSDCGCGFTVVYSLKDGSVINKPATVFNFLRPSPAPIVGLTNASESTSAADGNGNPQ